MEIIKGSYWIVGGLPKEELFASHQLGDNQHRRDYIVNLRPVISGAKEPVYAVGEAIQVRLRIDDLKRTKSTNDAFDFEAVAVLPTGLVRVSGYISVAAWMSVRGDLHTLSRKRCSKCFIETYTDRKRCDECGEEYILVLTPTLDPDPEASIRHDYKAR